ncbi:MAG: S-layer homology domain-containing protein, partial [Bacillota bacterium]|nr:S-layer homology domain-containing protein [Bacillota bacterium]
LSFTDVKKTHWALKQINAVVKNGFFKGATTTKFKPDAYITRAEIAAVIYRCQGIQDSSLDTSDYYFKDTKNNWAGKYIEELYRCKIIVGDGQNYNPNNQVKRAEAVTFLNRMLYRGPLVGITPQFKDVPATYWASSQIAEAVFDHKFSRGPNESEKYEGN